MRLSVKYSQSLMFADDFKLFLSICSEDDKCRLQSDLDGVNVWCKNKLPLTVNNRKRMVFGSIGDLHEHTYTIGENPLQLVN